MPTCDSIHHIRRIKSVCLADNFLFTSETYDWPIGEQREGRASADLVKPYWDPLLNPDDKCPSILAGLTKKLEVTYFNEGTPWSEQEKDCSHAQPESLTWNGDFETSEYFLFQDQGFEKVNGGYEVLKPQGLVLTDKVSGLSKEFTVMSGNVNGKVQQLQPIDPLDPMSSGGVKALFKDTTSKDRWDYQPFWRAVDRIWPSEWAVQALFSLTVNSNVNGNSQYDGKHIVGGYNSFGRRPTAIVQANVGGTIGGINNHGVMIEEGIWQFLERRCWHNAFSNRQPLSLTTQNSAVMKEYSPLSQYDLGAGKPIMWKDLDQGLRDYWRGLGLGVDSSNCQGGQLLGTLVTNNAQCKSGKAKCTRVNYHTVQRWNIYNNDNIAEKNFNARNFTIIFFTYDCEGKADGSLPNATPRTWDKIELSESGKLLAGGLIHVHVLALLEIFPVFLFVCYIRSMTIFLPFRPHLSDPILSPPFHSCYQLGIRSRRVEYPLKKSQENLGASR